MDANTTPPSASTQAAFDAALKLHSAAFAPARDVIARHDALRHELAAAMRMQAEIDRAAKENISAMVAGCDTSETQAALAEAVRQFAEHQGGRWLALFWFLTSPTEDLTYAHTH